MNTGAKMTTVILVAVGLATTTMETMRPILATRMLMALVGGDDKAGGDDGYGNNGDAGDAAAGREDDG